MPLRLFDGLVVADWKPAVFKSLADANIGAVNATCCIWEDATETLANIAAWHRWFDYESEYIYAIYDTSDLDLLPGRTGVVLGFQNLSSIEDRIEYLRLFRRLGVGIAQLTYNTQNLVGCGCYERVDAGLTGFGREVVSEMNRIGMAIDLSHVGNQTAQDAIELSSRPVAFSHVLPYELKAHPRNKSTSQLRQVADRDGMIGVTFFPSFLPDAADGHCIDSFAEVVDWMVTKFGEEHVGIGSDLTEGHSSSFFEWIRRDKGRYRELTEFSSLRLPAGLTSISELPALEQAFFKLGWSSGRVERVMMTNWLEFFRRSWS